MSSDRPTEVMPEPPEKPEGGGPADAAPTEPIPVGEPDPTSVMASSNPRTGERRRREEATETLRRSSGQRKGIAVLIASIVASLLLVGVYLWAGGPVEPDKPSDPCDSRAWTDPDNAEGWAQQATLSVADGAACELGMSREELVLGVSGGLEEFQQAQDLSDAEIEEAMRVGLNRAVDDAVAAGALGDGLFGSVAESSLKGIVERLPYDYLRENVEGIVTGEISFDDVLKDLIQQATGDFFSNPFSPGSPDEPAVQPEDNSSTA